MTSKSDTRAVIGGKGANTREEIVARALNIAALEGLGALSIGGLAKELKMSKSGLFVHFGSKENLATAVVERASVLFFDHVLVPIEEGGLEGIERVWGSAIPGLTSSNRGYCREAISSPEPSFSAPGRVDPFPGKSSE